jgi:nuclear GTP-binding protein
VLHTAAVVACTDHIVSTAFKSQQVKEHKRKERKEARKHPHLKKKKDPGIPNSMPFKAEILAEIEYVKKRAVEQKDAQKEKRRLELVS